MFEYLSWLKLETVQYNALSIIIAFFRLGAIGLAASNIKQQRRQLKKLSNQVEIQTEQTILQRETVFVSSYSHFSKIYIQVFGDLPKLAVDERDRENWWYRYWDILIAEVYFCPRGQLDKLIFELWMNELARNFFRAPHGLTRMGTFADNCEDHFDRVLAGHNAIRIFFRELRMCAQQKNDYTMAKEVNKLVEKSYNIAK